MKCPECGEAMAEGALYVRGLGSSLSWSQRRDVPFWSRDALEQLPLDRLSRVVPRAQAILDGWRCEGCRFVVIPS